MLVKTGGQDRTQACGACHGADLKGTAIAPPIAGRQPGYLARQMYDMQTGTRNGDAAKLMRASVEKLTEDDLIAISGYVFREDHSPAPDFLRMAVELGASCCLHKPFTPNQLLRAIDTCLNGAMTQRRDGTTGP